MMLGIGEGVAIAGVCFSGAAVAITAIKTRAANGNGNGKRGGVSPEICAEKHRSIDQRMDAMDGKLDQVLTILMNRRA